MVYLHHFSQNLEKAARKLEDYESQSFIINNESAYSFTAADILLMLPCPLLYKGLVEEVIISNSHLILASGIWLSRLFNVHVDNIVKYMTDI